MRSSIRVDRLRLRHLRLLELADQFGSLRAVGAELGLSQPAVSKMVQDLEDAFGTPLVERSPRGVRLTAAGWLAMQRAGPGLAAFDRLAEELSGDGALTLRIGTNPALTTNLVPSALRRLRAEGGALRFHLQAGLVGQVLQGLLDGTLDCYVGRMDFSQLPETALDALRFDPLLCNDLVIVCPADHPAAAMDALRAPDLARWAWALPPTGASNRIALEAGLRALGLPGPDAAVEMAGAPTALVALARELGLLTCVPRLMVEVDPEPEGLVVIDPPDLALPPIQVGFVAHEDALRMAPVRAFRAALLDAVEEAKASGAEGGDARRTS